MNKIGKIILIIISILSTLFLIYNIILFSKNTTINKDLEKKITNTKQEITKLTKDESTLKEEIDELENNNKDKVKLYNKWQSHEKELKEKMNQ